MKLGLADFTSLTGYNVNSWDSRIDFTPIFGGPNGLNETLFGVSGAPVPQENKAKKVTQEFRLSTPLGTHFDWLLGAFYTHETSQFVGYILATDPVTGAIHGYLENSDSYPSTYAEYAGFTDLTLHVNDQFDVQLGVRESHIQQTYSETVLGGPSVEDLYGFPSPIIEPEIKTNADAFTYLFTPQYKFTPDEMAYVRIASGYRPGGPNSLAKVYGIPLTYQPDKTTNYEVGYKADLVEHRLTIDTSVYYIDWKDIQLEALTVNGASLYGTNASGAKSAGIELAIQGQPIQSVTLAGWLALNNAELTKDLPPAPIGSGANYGVSGDRLPYAARVSGNLSADLQHQIRGSLEGFVGASISYTGDRIGNFTGQSPPPGPPEVRQYYPAYARTDLRAGVRFDQWFLDRM